MTFSRIQDGFFLKCVSGIRLNWWHYEALACQLVNNQITSIDGMRKVIYWGKNPKLNKPS